MVVANVKDGEKVYDVVLVVESTANLVPYMDVLMKSYIIPSLECFNGGPPDPVDYGIDYCCTLYDIVSFHAGDIAPAPAATCTLPTNSIHEVITHLEKLDLVGGAGQSSSHIAEGLSTALQVFDDFKKVRHSGVTSERHCLLICNSPPYHMAAEESSEYSGFNSEQLAIMMGKRGINLSIISPRKIAALQKLFDGARQGDSYSAAHQQKDYTTDARHMVLLHGYQLQERSHSPSADEDKQGEVNKLPHNVHSPASAMASDGQFKVPSSIVPSQAMPVGSQPSAQPSVQNAPGMAGPGGQMMPGHPPMGPGMHPGQQHMPAHSQAQVFQNQGYPMGPMGTAGQRMQGLTMQQAAAVKASMVNDMKNHVIGHGGPVSHPGMMGQGSVAMSTQGIMMVPQGQTVMASQGAGPQPGHPSMMQQPQVGMGNQMGMSAANPMTSQTIGMSNPNMVQTSMPMTMSQPQPGFPGTSQAVTNMGPRLGNPQQAMNFPNMMATGGVVTSSAGGMVGPGQGGDMSVTDPNAAARPAVPGLRDRKVVWTGNLEYHEKSKAAPGQVNPQQKITWLLSCRISIGTTEPDLTTINWPEKLSLQLLPQNMLSELQSLCRNSRQVAFHFSNTDQEALRNLHKLMGTGFAGCVHFPPQSASETRIILLLFSVKKRAFIGLIPNDQSAFVQGIKNVLTQHKLKTQPKALPTQMAQAGQLAAMNQQNLPQGQGGAGIDASVLQGGQNPMVTATTGPVGTVTNQPMLSTQNPGQPPQFAQQQKPGNPQKNPTMIRQQQQQQPQLMAMSRQQPQQQPQQQQGLVQRIQIQQQQPQQPNQQQLRQMLLNQQQQMRHQLLMQQQQQHGRQPGPQNQPGVMAPGSQAQMQGMQMGQMGGQPGQNLEDFSFEMM